MPIFYYLLSKENFVAKFNDAESTPLCLFPLTSYEPLLDFANQNFEMLRVRPHQSIKLSKFAWAEENFCHSKLEIVVIQTQGFKQSLAKHSRVKSCELRGQELFIHVVEIREGRPAWKSLLHQLQDTCHPGTLELGQNISSIKKICDHLRVRLDAADKVSTGRAKLLHEFTELTLELAAHTDKVQLPLVPGAGSHLEQGLDKLVLALQGHALQRGVEGIIVLLNEVLGCVAHCASEVANEESVLVTYLSMFPELGFPWQSQPEVAPVVVVHGAGEVLAVGLREFGLLVQEAEDPTAPRLDQIDTVLVIHKVDILNAQSLFLVQLLLVL